MLRKLRTRLTFANVMSCVAVFIALGGTAYAAATITSADIVDGQVKTVDLGDAAVTERKIAGGVVTSDKVRDNNLRSRDVLNDSLTGEDINESSLTVGSLRGPPGPTFGSFGGTDPTGSPDFIASADNADLVRAFTTPSAGRLLVEAHYRDLFVRCTSLGDVRVGLYVDRVPVPATHRTIVQAQDDELYSAVGVTSGQLPAGNHLVAIGVACTNGAASLIDVDRGHSIGAVLLGG